MDYQAVLYDPIYARLGVSATLTPLEPGLSVSLTVIDKTAGIAIDLGDTSLQTVKPAAAVRMVELSENDLEPADVDGGTITFNGKTWTIKGFMPKPSPNGEADGEVLLFLIEDPNAP